MIVPDASIIVTALIVDDRRGSAARRRLVEDDMAAPHLLDLEVLSVLRRQVGSGRLRADRAERAIRDLNLLPIDRIDHRSLLERCWELRENVTAYDAAYVAVAEGLDARLVTGDERLAAAPGLRCPVEVI